MKNFRIFKKGSPEYVYYHGLARAKFGKRPTAILYHKFQYLGDLITITDREVAFNISRFIVEEGNNTSFLLGKPFLRSEIKSGIESFCCKLCFHREGMPSWPKNQNVDCNISGGLAKKFFGWPIDLCIPSSINFKDLGNYCPYFLSQLDD